MTPIEAGEEILRCIDYVLKQYPQNQDDICELDKQTQDLLHKIEFTPLLTMGPGFKLAKQIQDIRLKRRELKDENELLKPLFDFLSQGTSIAFRNGLTNAVKSSRRRESNLTKRVYTPRSEAFKEAQNESNPDSGDMEGQTTKEAE